MSTIHLDREQTYGTDRLRASISAFISKLESLKIERLFNAITAAMADEHRDGLTDQILSSLLFKRFFERRELECFQSQNLTSEWCKRGSL